MPFRIQNEFCHQYFSIKYRMYFVIKMSWNTNCVPSYARLHFSCKKADWLCRVCKRYNSCISRCFAVMLRKQTWYASCTATARTSSCVALMKESPAKASSRRGWNAKGGPLVVSKPRQLLAFFFSYPRFVRRTYLFCHAWPPTCSPLHVRAVSPSTFYTNSHAKKKKKMLRAFLLFCAKYVVLRIFSCWEQRTRPHRLKH